MVQYAQAWAENPLNSGFISFLMHDKILHKGNKISYFFHFYFTLPSHTFLIHLYYNTQGDKKSSVWDKLLKFCNHFITDIFPSIAIPAIFAICPVVWV